MKSAAACLGLGVLAASVLACVRVPPQNVTQDRFDYTQAIAESWKEQTLVNIVRLRYGDAPTFMEVTSVINSYTVQTTVNAGAGMLEDPGRNSLTVGGAGSWANMPTVTYQPLTGQKFTQNILRSLPPKEVFQLVAAGWRARLILPTAIRSVNGLSNQSLGKAADPRFVRLIEALDRLQQSGAVGIRVEETKGEPPILVVLGPPPQESALLEVQRTVRQLLGLPEAAREFRITTGTLAQGEGEIAVVTRSMLEIMMELSFGIEVPPEDLVSGRVGLGNVAPGETPAPPIIRILSGKSRPDGAFVAVTYRGRWYWIEDTDRFSKAKFTFLMFLFSLAESGQGNPAPVVTVPAAR